MKLFASENAIARVLLGRVENDASPACARIHTAGALPSRGEERAPRIMVPLSSSTPR
jgi:hypothetical protein